MGCWEHDAGNMMLGTWCWEHNAGNMMLDNSHGPYHKTGWNQTHMWRTPQTQGEQWSSQQWLPQQWLSQQWLSHPCCRLSRICSCALPCALLVCIARVHCSCALLWVAMSLQISCEKGFRTQGSEHRVQNTGFRTAGPHSLPCLPFGNLVVASWLLLFWLHFFLSSMHRQCVANVSANVSSMRCAAHCTLCSSLHNSVLCYCSRLYPHLVDGVSVVHRFTTATSHWVAFLFVVRFLMGFLPMWFLHSNLCIGIVSRLITWITSSFFHDYFMITSWLLHDYLTRTLLCVNHQWWQWW